MARLQLALNVDDLDAAVDHYRTLFDTEPAKLEPGYANFAVADPPLKLVLFEGAGPHGTINHLGIEHPDRSAVAEELDRLRLAGLQIEDEGESHCCYAHEVEGWVHGVDGHRWEIYTVTGDAPTPGPVATTACCAPDDSSDASPATTSCC